LYFVAFTIVKDDRTKIQSAQRTALAEASRLEVPTQESSQSFAEKGNRHSKSKGVPAGGWQSSRKAAKTPSSMDMLSKPLPVLNGSLYLKWTEGKGFGVFLGNTVPGKDETVATYGGVVATYAEVNDRTQCYSLFRLKLKNFPFREDLAAVVDGTALWAGDGKFINQSCCPLVTTSPSLALYMNPRKTDDNPNRSNDLRILAMKLEYAVNSWTLVYF